MKKVSFLFGAGAEISFKLMDGKNFAFDLFKYLITNQNMENSKHKAKSTSKENKSSSDKKIPDVYLDKIFSIIFDEENRIYKSPLLNQWFLGKNPCHGTSYKISPDYCLELLKNSLEENRKNIVNEYLNENSDGNGNNNCNIDRKIEEIFRYCVIVKPSGEDVLGHEYDKLKQEQSDNLNEDVNNYVINHYLNKVTKNLPIISNNDKIGVEEPLKEIRPLSSFYNINIDSYQNDTHDKKDDTSKSVVSTFLKSKYFSFLVYSVLAINSTQTDNDDVKKAIKYLSSFIQFVIGADIYEIIDNLNQSFNLNSKNSTHQIEGINQIWNFEDVISLDYTKLSFEGMKSLFTENCDPIYVDKTIFTDEIEQAESKIIKYVCYKLFKDVVVSYLDYKQIIDSNWMYLYSPRRNWTKFVKISVFLLGVRNFIINHCKDLSEKEIKSSYYFDVFTKFNIAALGTTNYTPLLQQVYRSCENKDLFSSEFNPCFFNGSLYHWFSPCTNEVITSFSNKVHISNKSTQNRSDYELSTWSPYDNITEQNFYLPLIFTQNGTRPMTDISMAKDFVTFYDRTIDNKTKAICVIGFSFSETDAHVNGVIRNIMNNNNKLLVIVTSDELMDKQYYAQLKSKLRLNDLSNVYVLGVDINKNSKKLCSLKNDQIKNNLKDVPWYETIYSLIETH